MKKVTLFLIALIAASVTGFAQTTIGNAKVLSVEEANKLNGVAQPTINGKPYSQYKAEQEQLKKQEAAKQTQYIATVQAPGSRAAGNNTNAAVTMDPSSKQSPSNVVNETRTADPAAAELNHGAPVAEKNAIAVKEEKKPEANTASGFDPWSLSQIGKGEIIQKQKPDAVDPNSFLGMQASGAKEPTKPKQQHVEPKTEASKTTAVANTTIGVKPAPPQNIDAVVPSSGSNKKD
jgi:hypothetical protein